MGLETKLAALAETMSDDARAQLRLLLANAAGGLVREGRPPEQGPDAVAFSTALLSISRLQPHRDHVPPNGIAYRGRPGFMTDDLLRGLRAESARQRCRAVRFHDHLVVSDASLATQVALSSDLHSLIEAHAGHCAPSGKGDYLYYDQVGFGIDPHVDSEAFSMNVIMMLDHVHAADPSALVVYPPHSPPERLFLAPGELVVLFADSIAHARERMKRDERVSIVAFGFRPVA